MKKAIFCLSFLSIICFLSSCEKCIPTILCPYRNPQFYSIEGGDTSFLFYPNAFTPNGDGINDLFLVYRHNISTFSCHIYNGSGRQVFEIDDGNQPYPWDGQVNGKQAPVGIYAVQINAMTNKGKPINLSGTLSLVGGQLIDDRIRKIEGNVYLELKNSQFESQIDLSYKGFNPNVQSGETILTDQVHNCN